MKLSDHGIYGCVFDFDGTIVLSEHVHIRAWQDLAGETGFELPPKFLAESIGMSDQQLAPKLAKAWSERIPSEEILNKKRDYYLRRSRTECTLVPGVVEIIGRVASETPIAIATSSSEVEVEPILDFFKLRTFFQKIFTVESVQHPKPDPEIYELACRSINVKTSQCLVFEDSPAGSQSARQAGCKLVTLGTAFDPKELGTAWFSIRDYNDPKVLCLWGQVMLGDSI